MKVYTADWLFWHWAEGRFGWLVGWLHLSIPPSLVPSPLPVSFYSTVKFLAAQPVTAVERQPVLSVLSAPAFSWLGEMSVSILHQYPFIAIALVSIFFKTHWEESETWKQVLQISGWLYKLWQSMLRLGLKETNVCRRSVKMIIVVSS